MSSLNANTGRKTKRRNDSHGSRESQNLVQVKRVTTPAAEGIKTSDLLRFDLQSCNSTGEVAQPARKKREVFSEDKKARGANLSSKLNYFSNLNLEKPSEETSERDASPAHSQERESTPLEQAGKKRKVAGKPKKKKVEENGGSADSKPKRPLSAYNFFFRDERARIIGEKPSSTASLNSDTRGKPKSKTPHHKISFDQLGKQIARRWKALDEQSRTKYSQMAEEDSLRYRSEMKLYYEQENEKRRAKYFAQADPANDDSSTDGKSVPEAAPEEPKAQKAAAPDQACQVLSQNLAPMLQSVLSAAASSSSFGHLDQKVQPIAKPNVETNAGSQDQQNLLLALQNVLSNQTQGQAERAQEVQNQAFQQQLQLKLQQQQQQQQQQEQFQQSLLQAVLMSQAMQGGQNVSQGNQMMFQQNLGMGRNNTSMQPQATFAPQDMERLRFLGMLTGSNNGAVAGTSTNASSNTLNANPSNQGNNTGSVWENMSRPGQLVGLNQPNNSFVGQPQANQGNHAAASSDNRGGAQNIFLQFLASQLPNGNNGNGFRFS